MSTFNTFDVLKKLTDANGVSGDEMSAAFVALELLREYAPEAYIDAHGSVVGFIGKPEGDDSGKGSLLLDAHIDQVGLIVTYIDEAGFVKAGPCGGIDRRALAAQEVTIFTSQSVNTRKKIKGIICTKPPHATKSDDANKAVKSDEIWIDVGMDAERAKEAISPGDSVIVNGELKKMLGSTVSGCALDDRAGVCAILYALHLLKESGGLSDFTNKPYLSVSFSIQEELGHRGAAMTAYSANPEYALAVDVSYGLSPGVTDKSGNSIGKLGAGPMIGYAPSLNRSMFEELKRVADDKNISYQLEIMSKDTSGTNADQIGIVRGGVKTALVSIPLRYMHTSVETADLRDIEGAGKLIAEFVRGMK